MKFGETKGTKGLLKLPTFDFAMLIFGDIRPQQYPETHSKYGNLRRRRHFAAKKRQAGDALAAMALHMCFYTVSRKKGATLFLPVTPRNSNRFSKFFYHHAPGP